MCFKCDVCNAIFSPVTRGVDRRHCFVQLPPTQPVPTPLFCVIFGHTHMCRCVCVCVYVGGCVHSPFVNKQRTSHTQGQARLGRQRPVDMPNRRRRPAVSPLLPTLSRLPSLYFSCTLCVCRILRVGSIRLDKQDDQGRLQLSSFKRMPSVVALWQREG